MKQIVKIRMILLALPIALLNVGCGSEGVQNPMTEYRWDVSESAPKEYSMKIISGFLEAADGYKKDIPSRVVLNNGWGSSRSNMATGRAIMPAPKRMEVTWFSYREDTFYHGAFELPFEKIQALLADKEPMPYSEEFNPNENGRFVVGVAPQGFVVVWLSYGNHRQVIFTGKAVPVEGIPWSAVSESKEVSKEQIIASEIADAMKDSVGSLHIDDPTYWQRLHSELYRYDIKVESEYTPYSYTAGFTTSEVHDFIHDAQAWSSEPRSILESILFEYFFPNRIPVVSVDNINSDEMYAAFRKLSKSDPNSLEVVVKVNGNLLDGWKYTAQLFVRNQHETIEIKDYRFKPFSNHEALEKVKASKNLMRYMNYPDKPARPQDIPPPKKKFWGIF